MIRYAHADNSMQFRTNASERFRIDSSGNSIFKGSGTDVTISPTDGLINFGMDGRTSFVTGTNACYIYSGSGASGDIPAGTLILQARSNVDRDIVMVTGSTPTEKVRLKANGAIGLSGANYGSSGQVLTSQGSGSAVQWATASSGGWTVHKDATTAFSNAAIEQTSGLSASTDVIQIIAYKLRAGNGSGTDICVQLGTSGGYTGTYNDIQRYFNSSGSQETNRGHDQSRWSAWHGQGNPFSQTNMEFSGTLTITRMGGNNFVMESQSIAERTDNNTQYLLINAGRLELGAALTKIRIYTATGNNFSHGNVTIRSM